MTDNSASETNSTALTDYTVELQSTDPSVAFEEGDSLPASLTDGRIISLGEATHGTREFFQLKHRFLRYLVERGARVFALEANAPETLAINDYVVHGEGDPQAALEGVYFWTWNVDAVLSMVEWLRSFNEGRPLDDRVRFFGFDAQYTTGAVSRLDAFLERADVPAASFRDELAAVDDDAERPGEADIQPRLDAADGLVGRLRSHLADNRDRYITQTSERSYAFARRHLTVIEQATAYQRALYRYDGDFEGELTDDDREAVEEILRVRDRAMADNVDWLVEFTDAEPLVLWAHDAHVNREKHVIRGTNAASAPMGKLLADRHGEDYVAVGFSFGSGSFQAISPGDGLEGQTLDSPVSGTIDATLAALGNDIALLDVRDARRDKRLDDLLTEPQPHFSTGATYDDESPEEYLTEYTYGDAFDLVCYVDETTRARPAGEE